MAVSGKAEKCDICVVNYSCPDAYTKLSSYCIGPYTEDEEDGSNYTEEPDTE